MIPTNATIIRKAYDDFAKGDIPAVLEAFDASITWHVPGHSPLSGDYKGQDEGNRCPRPAATAVAKTLSLAAHLTHPP
jgi:ketosteroid isomerase-like protein